MSSKRPVYYISHIEWAKIFFLPKAARRVSSTLNFVNFVWHWSVGRLRSSAVFLSLALSLSWRWRLLEVLLRRRGLHPSAKLSAGLLGKFQCRHTGAAGQRLQLPNLHLLCQGTSWESNGCIRFLPRTSRLEPKRFFLLVKAQRDICRHPDDDGWIVKLNESVAVMLDYAVRPGGGGEITLKILFFFVDKSPT